MHTLINSDEWLQKTRRIAGVMSGTSLDGIDVAIVDFVPETSLFSPAFGCRMLHVHTCSQSFTTEQREFLMSIIEQPQPASVIADLPFLLSAWYAEVIARACSDVGMQTAELDAIGVHGQTLWHSPQPHVVCDTTIGSTWQACSISALAQRCRTMCVGDFRAADVALGGQGAPLVPIFDAAFMRQEGKHSVALNVGGMANLSVLRAGESEDQVQAFDTGPGNVWIDAAVKMLCGQNYDKDGRIAAGGQRVESLWDALTSMDFVHKSGPKSTGREMFSRNALEQLLQEHAVGAAAGDIVHTLSCFSAWSVATNIVRVAKETQRVIVSGGGSRNPFIIKMLREYLPGVEVVISDEIGIPSQSKEAMCFAYLAWRSIAGLTSNLPSVSAAERRAVLGSIAFGN